MAIECCDLRGRGDRFQAILVVATVDNANNLDQKGIKLELVVSAVGPDDRDRCCGSGLNPVGRAPERFDLCPQGVENSLVSSDAIRDSVLQFLDGLRIEHGPSFGPREVTGICPLPAASRWVILQCSQCTLQGPGGEELRQGECYRRRST